MAYEIKAPNKIPLEVSAKGKLPKVFLGGSIEMGKAEMWQARLVDDMSNFNVVFLNPRRDDFDTSQEQSKDNPYFAEQVKWELNFLERSDLLLFYLAPGTLSPISLLEIGLFCHRKPHLICCPDGFGRKGNIEIVSELYKLNMVESYDEMLLTLKKMYQPFKD